MKRKFFFAAVFTVFFFSVLSSRAQMPEYEENAVYVRFKEAYAPSAKGGEREMAIERVSSLKKLQKAYGLHQSMHSMRLFDNPMLERTFTLRFDSAGKQENLIEALLANPAVEAVERIPVYYIQGAGATQSKDADPFYGTVDGVNLRWHLDLIHAEEAWAIQKGRPEIKVAVVDNAVWGDHPDLQIAAENQYNVLLSEEGTSAPPATVTQDEECRSLDNCRSYNWSHGTHCAGAIGAIRDNGTGSLAIGSGVTLMGISCPGTNSTGLQVLNGYAGITWAAEHGAKVISLSWGGLAIAETERAIIQSCIDRGITIVAAAGNNGARMLYYPAYLPGVISVVSVNSDNKVSSFSNYGNYFTVAAPGGFFVINNKESFNCILSTTFCQSQSYRMNGVSTLNGEYYDGMYGTSMATPVTAGLCGLLLSADSTLSPYDIRSILAESAQELVVVNEKRIMEGSGVIDAAAALKLLKQNVPAPRNASVSRTNRIVTLSWDVPQTHTFPVKNYRIFRDGEIIGQTEGLAFADTMKGDGLYRYGICAVYENGDISIKKGIDILVPALYDVKVLAQPENCGKVTGAGSYEKKAEIRLTATANKGCTFVRWTENNKILGKDSVLDYTVEYPTEIKAVFSGEPDFTANDPIRTVPAVRIYPNPTHDQLTIKAEDAVFYSVEVFGLSGKPIRKENAVSGTSEMTIDLSSLAPGMYIVKVLTEYGYETEKVNKL